MSKNFKISILFLSIVVILFILLRVNATNKNNIEAENIITTGMTEGQKEYFSSKLSEATNVVRLFRRGKRLRDQGEYESALNIFQKIFENKDDTGYKGMAIINIADTYEKKRDYKKALEYMIIDRDEYINDWAKEPVLERIKYLEYASRGNYDLTIKHAELAMQAEMKVHGTKKPRKDYIERLNDLKASKEYIESLKTK